MLMKSPASILVYPRTVMRQLAPLPRLSPPNSTPDIWGHHIDFRLAWCTRPGLRRRGSGVASAQGLIGGSTSRVDIVAFPAAVMSMREGPCGCQKVPVLTGPASVLAGSDLHSISPCDWRQGENGNW